MFSCKKARHDFSRWFVGSPFLEGFGGNFGLFEFVTRGKFRAWTRRIEFEFKAEEEKDTGSVQVGKPAVEERVVAAWIETCDVFQPFVGN